MMMNYGILTGFKLQLADFWEVPPRKFRSIWKCMAVKDIYKLREFHVHMLPCDLRYTYILMLGYWRLANSKQLLNPSSLHVEDRLLRPSTPEPRYVSSRVCQVESSFPLLDGNKQTHVYNIKLTTNVKHKAVRPTTYQDLPVISCLANLEVVIIFIFLGFAQLWIVFTDYLWSTLVVSCISAFHSLIQEAMQLMYIYIYIYIYYDMYTYIYICI